MPRSRSPRLTAAVVEIAVLRASLAAAQARVDAAESHARDVDARWRAAYQDVVDDARELAALARGAGVGGEVVDDWFVPPPAPAEPEEEPDP